MFLCLSVVDVRRPRWRRRAGWRWWQLGQAGQTSEACTSMLRFLSFAFSLWRRVREHGELHRNVTLLSCCPATLTPPSSSCSDSPSYVEMSNRSVTRAGTSAHCLVCVRVCARNCSVCVKRCFLLRTLSKLFACLVYRGLWVGVTRSC